MAESFLINFLVAAAVLFFSSILQCAVGFGGGLLLTPIMLFAGWSLPEKVAMSIGGRLMQNIFGAYQLRKDFSWKEGLRPNLIRFIFLPIGIVVLKFSQNFSPILLEQSVGGIILIYLLIQAFSKVQVREQIHFAWELLAMSFSGFLLGFCGMGGPPLAMWVDAHGWPGDKTRSFLFHSFSLTAVPHALLLLGSFDKSVYDATWIGMLALPAAYFGAVVGLRLGDWMSDRLLRMATWCVLAAIAIRAIVSG